MGSGQKIIDGLSEALEWTKERAEIDRILADHYTPEETVLWWGAPHPLFNGQSAEQMVADGRQGEVLQALKALDEAVYL